MTLPLLLCALTAGAYETDQLTDRDRELADSRDIVNDWLNLALARAVEHTNALTECDVTADRAHLALARAIRNETSRNAWVMERGFFRAPGFSSYSAWVERSQVIEKRSFVVREDLYDDIGPWQSVILSTMGPNSTLRVGDTLLGTDKFDHFLDFGFRGWVVSNRGRRPERAERFSVRSERLFFGLMTSKTFSYGDIAANADGYQFFRDLLGPEGFFGLDADGCLAQTRPFDWADWLDWEYDEALNPPVYTPLVERLVTERLEREPERYCRAWRALGGAEYEAHIDDLLSRTDLPLPKRRGERDNPFNLALLCGEDPSL